ncbi:MAG: hypothetical protein JW829_08180 [Pirellulales bacterium]|nr:hypothetical protein [Pirellulales bacterium]
MSPNCWILTIIRADTLGTDCHRDSWWHTDSMKGGISMKHLSFALAAVVLFAVSTGCSRQYLNQGSGYGLENVACGMAGCAGDGGAMCNTDACEIGGDCLSGDCLCNDPDGMQCCPRCGGRMRGNVCSRCNARRAIVPGPPVAQVAYPYYTVRGPRDFLCKNPPSIGP